MVRLVAFYLLPHVTPVTVMWLWAGILPRMSRLLARHSLVLRRLPKEWSTLRSLSRARDQATLALIQRVYFVW